MTAALTIETVSPFQRGFRYSRQIRAARTLVGGLGRGGVGHAARGSDFARRVSTPCDSSLRRGVRRCGFALQGLWPGGRLHRRSSACPASTTTRWAGVPHLSSYLWNDHAYLRLGFKNDHWISPELVRTSQPWPHQLAEWKQKGIKTVINLRGGFDGSFYALEKYACDQLGLKMVDFVITSREVPIKERVLGARDLFESIEYPA